MLDDSIDQSSCDSNSVTKFKKKIKRPDKPLYHPPKSKNSLKIIHPSDIGNKSMEINSDQQNNNNDDDKELNWDSLYDDNGDIIQDLNNHFESIDLVKNDNSSNSNFSKFCDKTSSPENVLELDDSDTNHILEIYDFSTDLKTRDLTSCLNLNNFKNFEINWVDDTHALVTFQSSAQAFEALNKVYPIMKLRPLSQALSKSKVKAKKIKESDFTRKLRPETSAVTARRLVIGALGIKANLDPEQKRAEREKLRLAKEKKEKQLKQAKSIWNNDNE